MSTLNELIAHRDTAGARYAAAIVELRAAFGDLAAIERILMSHTVAGVTDRLEFGGERPNPVPLRHPKYAPDVGGTFEDDIAAAFPRRSAAFGRPD